MFLVRHDAMLFYSNQLFFILTYFENILTSNIQKYKKNCINIFLNFYKSNLCRIFADIRLRHYSCE